ncbi:MAG: hypothetical protein ACTHWZ_01555 [Peptoniphilaceae bacterium]
MANFTLISNDKKGGKNYHSCSAYGEKQKKWKILNREILSKSLGR